MNEHDSEIMAGLLIENGYVQASSRDVYKRQSVRNGKTAL